MFDSLVTARKLPKTRWAVGWSITTVAHAVAVSMAIWFSAYQKLASERQPEVAVSFVKPPPPPPPPPPPAKKKATPKKIIAKPKPQMVQPKVVPVEKPPDVLPPPEPEQPEEADDDEGVEGGVEGGVAGGVIGGTLGGIVGGQVGTAPPPPPPPEPVEWSETMTLPRVLSAPQIQWTQKALEKEVEGLMIVKCVLSIEGVVHDCRVLQSLPFMDKAVVQALERSRYTPAMFQGKPIEVKYTFKIRLNLPR